MEQNSTLQLLSRVGCSKRIGKCSYFNLLNSPSTDI